MGSSRTAAHILQGLSGALQGITSGLVYKKREKAAQAQTDLDRQREERLRSNEEFDRKIKLADLMGKYGPSSGESRLQSNLKSEGARAARAEFGDNPEAIRKAISEVDKSLAELKAKLPGQDIPMPEGGDLGKNLLAVLQQNNQDRNTQALSREMGSLRGRRTDLYELLNAIQASQSGGLPQTVLSDIMGDAWTGGQVVPQALGIQSPAQANQATMLQNTMPQMQSRAQEQSSRIPQAPAPAPTASPQQARPEQIAAFVGSQMPQGGNATPLDRSYMGALNGAAAQMMSSLNPAEQMSGMVTYATMRGLELPMAIQQYLTGLGITPEAPFMTQTTPEMAQKADDAAWQRQMNDLIRVDQAEGGNSPIGMGTPLGSGKRVGPVPQPPSMASQAQGPRSPLDYKPRPPGPGARAQGPSSPDEEGLQSAGMVRAIGEARARGLGPRDLALYGIAEKFGVNPLKLSRALRNQR